MNFEQIRSRIRAIEDTLKPAACFLGGMKYNSSRSVNCSLEPEKDALNSIIKSGVLLNDLRVLLERELDKNAEPEEKVDED